jgi:hypothetical protein
MLYLKRYSHAVRKRSLIVRVLYAAELRGLKSDCQNILTKMTFDLVAEGKF